MLELEAVRMKFPEDTFIATFSIQKPRVLLTMEVPAEPTRTDAYGVLTKLCGLHRDTSSKYQEINQLLTEHSSCCNKSQAAFLVLSGRRQPARSTSAGASTKTKKSLTTSVSKELHDMKLRSKVSDLKQNATNTALSLQDTETNDSIESESIGDSLQGHYDHVFLNRYAKELLNRSSHLMNGA